MNNKKIIMYVTIILLVILITNCLSIEITKLIASINEDNDYQILGLEIEDYDIDYCTIYNKDVFGEYKVYKINDYYSGDSLDRIKEQLQNSELWTKNKFYEYIMTLFYDKINKTTTKIDREDLYYYDENDIYAILDIKNAKLYYYKNALLNIDNDYIDIIGKIDNYTAKEVYSVKGGLQNDGTDYYTYEFTEEKGKEIEAILNKQQNWNKKKLAEDILDSFEYNEEVHSIENGYYYYTKICRTSDPEKKYNFTDEEATGWEIGIYDMDTNKLYYYWTSY